LLSCTRGKPKIPEAKEPEVEIGSPGLFTKAEEYLRP
jgi:hypothetical protein